jgi:hypothetical protein
MEAFWALEDIKRHEAEVKQQFIYKDAQDSGMITANS